MSLTNKDSDERVTPQWLFDVLNLEFPFWIDLAANRENRKVRRYYGLDHEDVVCRDALTMPWADDAMRDYVDEGYEGTPEPLGLVGWCNPPYSAGQLKRWCAKAEHEAGQGFTTVMLLPGDISTQVWHRYVLTGERRTLKTRLKFEGAPLDKRGQLPPAKFGSILRIFRPSHKYWSFT